MEVVGSTREASYDLGVKAIRRGVALYFQVLPLPLAQRSKPDVRMLGSGTLALLLDLQTRKLSNSGRQQECTPCERCTGMQAAECYLEPIESTIQGSIPW